MDFPADLFVRPVEGAPDTFAFQFGFGLAPDGKAVDGGLLDEASVTELEDGDLLIEGLAANFEGLDRQGENFMDGAFKRGIKSFLEAGGPLCFHHDNKLGIGKVLELNELEGKGLHMKARVDKQEEGSPLRHIYNAIKRGTYKGLSVGGFFKRKLTDAGMRIADMDFTEISVTPVPVHTGTSFAVVAGKALENLEPAPEEATPELIAALESATKLVELLEGKALPKKYNSGVAADLGSFLNGLGSLRQTSTQLRSYGEAAKDADFDSAQQEELGGFADEVESALVKWESQAHKLAAKFGPLPPQPELAL